MSHRMSALNRFKFFGGPDPRYASILRHLSSSPRAIERIRKAMEPFSDAQLAKLAEIRAQADIPLMSVTSKHILTGMKGVPTLLWDLSSVDPYQGIKYRGHELNKLMQMLPRFEGDGKSFNSVQIRFCAEYPPAESIIWLLLTGSLPTLQDCDVLQRDLVHAGWDEVTEQIVITLESLPEDMHPITQLSIGVLAAQPSSLLAVAQDEGRANKNNVWEFVLADSLNLVSASLRCFILAQLARLPIIAGFIYRRLYHAQRLHGFKDDVDSSAGTGVDWVGRLAFLMTGHGRNSATSELLRLYVILHADHEGGNVSAHTANVVGSALSDPYLAFAAALCGLAGPLHGLANQEALKYLQEIQSRSEAIETDEELRRVIPQMVEEDLNNGKVIPGYGHAVLRCIDPRFVLIRDWSARHAPNDRLVR